MTIPWLAEITKHFGEDEHDPDIKQWLKSDGKTVGDPAVYPWCGDAVQTAIRNTLPNEPFTGKVAQNPYYALNWLDFGKPSDICLGAIAVFVRKGGGHVGFVIGIDRKRGLVLIRGGNQKNSVSDAWLPIKERLQGCRVPITYGTALPPVPELDSTGKTISTNEA